MNDPESLPWEPLESLIRNDPGKRGLPRFRTGGNLLGEGHLRDATVHLAESAASVAIVTGFCVVSAAKPAAETDGPPGALFLARAAAELGIDVALVSDAYGAPLLEVGCDQFGLPRSVIHTLPFEPGGPEDLPRRSPATEHRAATDAWVRAFYGTGPGKRLTHLIAVERAGPSHHAASIRDAGADEAAMRRFERSVPAHDRDICHDMRGTDIHGYTAKSHRLVEWIDEAGLPVRTIGIGDGGNEIGMGAFAWDVLRTAIGQGPGEITACRIATDHTLPAGVSDWAAYAVALALVHLAGKPALGESWTAPCQQQLIESIVAETDAVDGPTGTRIAHVDGLTLDQYLRPLVRMRELLGYSH